MDLIPIYIIGLSIVFVMALVWSFILDKNKPPTKKEFLAKLIARALVLAVFFAVIVGVLSVAMMKLPLPS